MPPIRALWHHKSGPPLALYPVLAFGHSTSQIFEIGIGYASERAMDSLELAGAASERCYAIGPRRFCSSRCNCRLRREFKAGEDLVLVFEESDSIAAAATASVGVVANRPSPSFFDLNPVIGRRLVGVRGMDLIDAHLVTRDITNIDSVLLHILGDTGRRLEQVFLLFLRRRIAGRKRECS